METLAHARHGRAWLVLREIIMEPGLRQRDLADRVGMTRKVLRGHLDLLRVSGLIDESAEGRVRRYVPGPDTDDTVRDLLDEEPGLLADEETRPAAGALR